MKLIKNTQNHFSAQNGESFFQGQYFVGDSFVDIHTQGKTFRLKRSVKQKRGQSNVQSGGLTAPMPGKILKVLVQQDSLVKSGETLMILEAMKMEHKISAPQDGKVTKIFFSEGERVSANAVLCEVK